MRTRTSNKDATFKVFYSKKVPKQRYFPIRRKIVRDKPNAHQHGSEPQQMPFLRENMRKGGPVQDSEDEYGESGFATTEEEEPTEQLQPVIKKRRKKRTSDAIEAGSSSMVEGAIRPIQKRWKGDSKTRNPKLPKVKTEIDSQEPEAESEHEPTAQPTAQPRRIRQSTMTQLVEGRRPGRGDKEPSFKAVRRVPRTSWGNTKSSKQERDRQQRTLTQMVPGVAPVIATTDDDSQSGHEEYAEGLGHAGDDDDENYNATIAAHLTQHGLFEPMKITHDRSEDTVQSQTRSQRQSIRTVQDSDWEDGDAIDDDNPAQYVPPSTSKRKRLPQCPIDNDPIHDQSSKTRFGLLATPEKRRIMEIPSSQSPPGSPLSTQVTPSKVHRGPLKERTANAIQSNNSPSKRRVMFQEPERVPTPPVGKAKFGGVVLDSEDDGDDLYDDDLVIGVVVADENAESSPQVEISPSRREDIGAETQAILREIDRVCAESENVKEETVEEDDHIADTINNRIRGTDAHATPVVVKSEPEEEEGPLPSPSVPHNFSNDLDGEPIQVPRSPPPAKLETQDSSSSDSNRVENQIQSEWQTYSQYHRAPPSSSMFVHRESDPFTYQDAPIVAPEPANAPQPSLFNFSQATTVDSSRPSPHTTPRKPRPVRASLSPQKIPNSQPSSQASTSPQKPPTLFIPSSFPSLGPGGTQTWSSPTVGRNHGERDFFAHSEGLESVEGFSIPPLPPVEDEDMFA